MENTESGSNMQGANGVHGKTVAVIMMGGPTKGASTDRDPRKSCL